MAAWPRCRMPSLRGVGVRGERAGVGAERGGTSGAASSAPLSRAERMALMPS